MSLKRKAHQMRISFFLCLLFFVSCRQTQTDNKNDERQNNFPSFTPSQESESTNLITCWGIGDIDLDDSFLTIEEKVGKGNIALDSLMVEGMLERIIGVVYKNTEKQITIHWNENKPPFKTIRYLEISNPKSPYKFANGIKIGTSVKELHNLNTKPFELYGFGWDGGGSFLSFGEGKLKNEIPCFGGVFQLQTQNTDKQVLSLMGDQKITSNHPSFQKYPAILVKIRVLNN